MALVEPADTGGHWYWLGDVVVDELMPVPVFKRDKSTWVVVRLLLPSTGTRARRVNKCGLHTCVNPDHWAFVSLDEAVLTDFDGLGWRRA